MTNKINLFILLAILISGCRNASSYETITTRIDSMGGKRY
jgi:hypothetical protein